MHDIVDLRSDTLTASDSRHARGHGPRRGRRRRLGGGSDRSPARGARGPAHGQGGRALFVSSGTQGNLVSVLAQTRPGQEIILDADSHIFNYEGRRARRCSAACRRSPVQDEARLPHPGAGARAHPAEQHPHPDDRASCAWRTPTTVTAAPAARRRRSRRWPPLLTRAGVPVHLDGARLFNAAVALGRPVADFARPVDSRHLLPVQGPGRAGGLPRLRLARLRGPRAAGAEDARRRHAPGRRAGRGRPRRARRPWWTVSPRTTRMRGASPRASAKLPRRPARPGQRADQHRHLPRGSRRAAPASWSPAAWPAR